MLKQLFLISLMCLMTAGAKADRTNLALTCQSVTASYTSSWNNLNAVNNGTKGFGMDLPNEETWGCYISTSGNRSEHYITYTWDRTCRIDEAIVYLWSDCQSGSGVAVPDSWKIMYLDENDEWQDVALLDGQDYTVERFEANAVTFEPVETKSFRLMLYAQQNDQYYSAMGVNEWEVYGEYTEEIVIDPEAKVNVAPYAESIEATYTASWNNLNSINNGTKGFGTELSNNETWGCYIGESTNESQQILTYNWAESYNVDSVSVYFWSDSESGQGVVVPQSWYIEYQAADGTMKQVTLLEGEAYTNERYEPNHVKFEAVTTTVMNLVLNAMPNGDDKYSAIGVNEWEVFSADMGYAQQLYVEYQKCVDALREFQSDLISDGIDGLAEVIEDALMDYEIDADETDADKIMASINYLQNMLTSAKSAYALCAEMETAYALAEKLLIEGLFPGVEELAEACYEVSDFMGEGYGSPEEIEANYQKILDAIDAYRFSQLYSEDEPADYSFMGKCFQFIKEEAAPTIDLETGEVTYPNIDSYSEGTVPGDAQATGWYLGETDGTQRVGFYQQRMCWFAEKTACSELTINQNLKNLPNGYYAVSAEMITKAGCLSNQHVYAKTQVASVVSPSLSAEGWDEGGNGQWERLTTDKILVYDGTLTIGAAGTGDNTTTQGMFAATNFILYYYGMADESNIESLFADKVKECQEECNSMAYAADKKQYQDVIDANKNATGYDDLKTAMKNLNAAQLVAQKSINAYNKFLVGPYKTLNDRIEAQAYADNVLTIAKSFVQLVDNENASEKATYKNAATINNVINSFMDEYAPAFTEAENIKSSDAEANDAVQNTLKEQMDYFENASSLPTTQDFYNLIEQLNNAARIAQIANNLANGGTDFTALIINPQVSTSSAIGWTIDNQGGDGNGVKSGQHYDGLSGYYFDTYNQNAGQIRCTIQQAIDNAPNGKYELQAMVRVSATPDAEGYYLFATADGDTQSTVFAPVHMSTHNFTAYDETLVTEDSSDSIIYVSNTYGKIWEEACDWIDNHYSTQDQELLDFYTNVFEANGQKGYGWQYVSLQVEVKNHQLTIGVTSDNELTQGHKDTEGYDCVPFSGTWFSADNFTLTLIEKGDNEGWSPATEIVSANEHAEGAINAIYSLNGVRMNALRKGVNIVRMSNGKTKKLLVR